MSDTTPTSPLPPPPPGGPVVAEVNGGGKKKVIAGGAGVAVLAAVVGGGAYAYNQLSGGGSQPSDVMPSSMQVYARLDLDPGASQKIELFKLLNKVPEVGEALGIEDADKSDVRKLIFDEIASNACPDLDYEKDVEPWLGDRVGIGANIDDEQFIIAVQVKDEKKSEDGLDALFKCGDEDYGIAFYEGYALLSDTQKSVDDALDAAKKESLSDNAEFSKSMDALGEKGVASAWVDAGSLVDSLKDLPEFAELSAEQRKQIEDAGSAAMALRVDGNAVELAGLTNEIKDLDGPTSPVGDLPKGTVAAVSLSGLGDAITEQWDLFLSSLESEFASGLSSDPAFDDDFLAGLSDEERALYEDLNSGGPGLDPTSFLDQFEAETGLKLPDDLASLLGKTFTLSIGGANLENLPTFAGPEDIEKLEIAIRTTDGKGSALDVMTKLADFATQNGIPLVAEKTDDGAVLATSSAAAKKASGGGDLGKSDAFKSVMPFGDDTTQAFFIDVNAILDALLKADPPEDLRKDFKDAKVIDAVGISAGNSDGHARFSLRVNFND